MPDKSPTHQYKVSYRQRVAETWFPKTEICNSLAELRSVQRSLKTYAEQMQEIYGEAWIKDISPVEFREVTYSPWQEVPLSEQMIFGTEKEAPMADKFTTWLDTFVEEKGLDRDHMFEVPGAGESDFWDIHLVSLGFVLSALAHVPPDGQKKVKDTLVILDYKNANVLTYFEHLAKALVAAQAPEKDGETS